MSECECVTVFQLTNYEPTLDVELNEMKKDEDGFIQLTPNTKGVEISRDEATTFAAVLLNLKEALRQSRCDIQQMLVECCHKAGVTKTMPSTINFCGKPQS